MRVIDFFCGAGGFSEGFRQQGFNIVTGIDRWQPAIDSHNLNHGLNDTTKNVMDFWSQNTADVEEINKILNTEFIIGSPSCVSFSMSNKAGKADKTSGVQLIEAYLRVVAVKKHQRKSILKAWYMENVPKSKEHIKRQYTFKNLNLSKWAKTINKNPEDIALNISGGIFNAGDYGTPQERKRFIVGEWIADGEFIPPKITHIKHIKSLDIRDKMPKPNSPRSSKKYIDPNYSSLKIRTNELTDHFYDTGLYEIEWEKAEYLKINHPYMGRMSFPENEDRTCRTITATRSAITREAMIYKSEYSRKGNGEYRSPTIREIACLMGYPYSYQFVGSEGMKWKQVGNSVCPQMSAALAKALRKKMELSEIKMKDLNFTNLDGNYTKINNLNTFKEKVFNKPRARRINARFRRHPLKSGNMTVDLMNYHPENKNEIGEKWYVAAFFGTGYDHSVKVLQEVDIDKIEKILEMNIPEFNLCRKSMLKKKFSNNNLQKSYEEDVLLINKNNPLKIIKELANVIRSFKSSINFVETDNLFPKKSIPLVQLLAMYGLASLIYSKGGQ